VTGTTMTVTYKLRHGVKWQRRPGLHLEGRRRHRAVLLLKYKDNNPTPLLSTSGWDQISKVDTPDDFTAVVNYKSLTALPVPLLGPRRRPPVPPAPVDLDRAAT